MEEINNEIKLADLIPGGNLNTVKEVAASIITQNKNRRHDKNIDVDKHWDMYRGEHSKYFVPRSREDGESFENRKRDAVKANYIKWIVRANTQFLYGRSTKVRRVFSSKEDATEKGLRDLLSMVGYSKFIRTARIFTGLFGEVVVRLVPVDTIYMNVPDVASETTHPKPVVLDTRCSFASINPWGRVVGIVIMSKISDFKTNTSKTRTELVVSDSRWTWDDDGQPVGTVNNYAMNEEFVVLRNNDEGLDDVQDVIGLNIQLDEALTDNKNFFGYHGWPQLVTEVDLQNVVKSPDKIWEISSDNDNKPIKDKMMFLQWDGHMKDYREYIIDTERRILKLADVALVSMGDPEALGQLRTGAAIVAAHSPSIRKAMDDQIMWEDNERKLLHSIASFDARIHKKSLSVAYPGLDIKLIWPKDYVPGEDLMRAETQASQANSHTRSLHSIISEINPDFTEVQVENERTRIIGDSNDLVDSTRKFVSEQAPGTSGVSGSTTSKSNEQKTASKEIG